jgi:hypothetical protein
MTRVAVGAFLVSAGLLLCVCGAATLLPFLVQPPSTLCEHKFSLRLVWPSMLIVAVALIYLRRIGQT